MERDGGERERERGGERGAGERETVSEREVGRERGGERESVCERARES